MSHEMSKKYCFIQDIALKGKTFRIFNAVRKPFVSECNLWKINNYKEIMLRADGFQYFFSSRIFYSLLPHHFRPSTT